VNLVNSIIDFVGCKYIWKEVVFAKVRKHLKYSEINNQKGISKPECGVCFRYGFQWAQYTL